MRRHQLEPWISSLPHLLTLLVCVHSVHIVSCDDSLRDGPKIQVPLYIVRGELLVSAEQGVHAFAADHINPDKVSWH